MTLAAKLVVYPPDENGWRRVRYDGVAIGVAHRPSDIRVFLSPRRGWRMREDVDRPTRGSLSGGVAARRLGSHRVSPGTGADRCEFLHREVSRSGVPGGGQ